MIKHIYNTTYVSPDKSLTLDVKILQSDIVKYVPGIGKVIRKATQCTVEKNGIIIGLGIVVRHFKDKDNLKFAVREACRKAFTRIYVKEVKEELYSKIFNSLYEKV